MSDTETRRYIVREPTDDLNRRMVAFDNGPGGSPTALFDAMLYPAIRTVCEQHLRRLVDRANGYMDPVLCVSFEPDAIRDHFADAEDGPIKEAVELATDEQLRDVGMNAITMDSLWREFAWLLEASIREVLGVPDDMGGIVS
jgi:hypothetical protein